ncbi:hypothetical protein, partial [Dinoroseobacter shibae]
THIAADLDRVYSTEDLGALEQDIAAHYGLAISVTDRFVNTGDQPHGEARWPRLMALLDTDAARAKLTAFVQTDEALLARLGLPV